MPERIQLRRTKGWRMPPNTVVVSRPSKWGNPFIVQPILPNDDPLTLQMDAAAGVCFSPEAAVARYKGWLKVRPELKRKVKAELRGKNLACWCPPGQPCHADVLFKIANGKESFAHWYQRLARVAERRNLRCVTPGNESAWRPYFDDGYTPQEAITEDMSYAT